MEDGKQVIRRFNFDYQFVFTGGCHHVELFYIKSKKKNIFLFDVDPSIPVN